MLGWILLAAGVAAAWWLYRTGDNSNRVDGLKRLGWGVPFLAVTLAAGLLFSAYVLLTWLLDSLWQIVTGREGFNPNGRVQRLWNWKDRNTRYVVTGEGSPKVLP